MTYGSGATGNYFNYDTAGRVTSQWQVTGSTPTAYSMSYSYNLAGMLTSETYPGGCALSYATNLALGTAVRFTDDPIVTYAENPNNATTVKSAHITQLRTAVNAARTLAGHAGWTNPAATGDVIYANPQSFNRYSYVQKDPVNFVDPRDLGFLWPGR